MGIIRVGCLSVSVAALLAPALVAAGQIDSSTFFALRRGMAESEIYIRAGPPDLVTSPGGEVIERESGVIDPRSGIIDTTRTIDAPTIKQLHYIPGLEEHDPHLTIITIRRGVVFELHRRKIIAPRPAFVPEREQAEAPVSRSDTDIRRERLDRTLNAAQRYATVRARIKARREAPGDSVPKRPVYRGRDPEGAAYFGDRPPMEKSP